jgi:hypothetical protein
MHAGRTAPIPVPPIFGQFRLRRAREAKPALALLYSTTAFTMGGDEGLLKPFVLDWVLTDGMRSGVKTIPAAAPANPGTDQVHGARQSARSSFMAGWPVLLRVMLLQSTVLIDLHDVTNAPGGRVGGLGRRHHLNQHFPVTIEEKSLLRFPDLPAASIGGIAGVIRRPSTMRQDIGDTVPGRIARLDKRRELRVFRLRCGRYKRRRPARLTLALRLHGRIREGDVYQPVDEIGPG